MRNAMCFFLTALVVPATCVLVLAAPRKFDDSSWRKWKNEIQIRVYYDIGIVSDTTQGGGSVWIYGMRIEDDGAEIPVWKHFVFERHAHLFSREYEYLPLNSNHVYLHFTGHGNPDFPIFFKMDRNTGTILKTGNEKDDYFGELKKQHMWYRMIVIDRPAMNNPQPQRIAVINNLRIIDSTQQPPAGDGLKAASEE